MPRRPIPAPAARLPDDPERRATTPHCWRLDSAKALELAGLPSLDRGRRRELHGRGRATSATRSSPARTRRPPIISSCVVDDAASGVTMVVRGADLRASTPIQRLLQSLLGLPEPTYLHHPLVTHEDGRRLAKRDLAPTLAAMREAGVDGPQLAARPACGRSFRLVSLSRRLNSAPCTRSCSILLLLAMARDAYVLVRGVIAMASGKDVTGEQSADVHAQARAVPGGRDRHRDPDPGRRRRSEPLGGAWSSSTRSTRAPATAAAPGWSTAAASASRACAWPRSARSTRPMPRSASPSPRSARARSPTSCCAIQNDLFDLGADVATPGEIDGALRIVAGQVERLEREIDAMNADLAPLDQLHPARRLGGRRRAAPRPRRRPPRRARRGRAATRPSRSTRSCSPTSTACRTICSSPRASSRRAKAATCSGSRARRAANSRHAEHLANFVLYRRCFVAGAPHGPGGFASSPQGAWRAALRHAQADARPRRAAVATPTRRSSRSPTLRRPNGTSRTRPGSSRPSCCAIMCSATARSTSATPSCSTAITRPKGRATPARGAGCSAARRSTRSAPIALTSTRRSSARCRSLRPTRST